MSQYIACPLCNKKDFELKILKTGRHIVRCRHDGLMMVNPQPTKLELDRIYNNQYFSSSKKRTESSVGYYDYLAEKPLLTPYFKRKVSLLKTFLLGKRVLEIGSSYGFFLEEANRQGLDILGIDISRKPVAYAKKQGLQTRTTDLFQAKFRSNSFDGVVAFHLIEHISNPLRFMKEVNRIVKPKGVVLLATPTYGGYLERLMGPRWFSYRHREHLYFFSKKTIRTLLTKADFTDIRVLPDETRWYPVKFLLQGVKYYFKNPWWLPLVRQFSFLTIPFPLDTMIVVAKKA